MEIFHLGLSRFPILPEQAMLRPRGHPRHGQCPQAGAVQSRDHLREGSIIQRRLTSPSSSSLKYLPSLLWQVMAFANKRTCQWFKAKELTPVIMEENRKEGPAAMSCDLCGRRFFGQNAIADLQVGGSLLRGSGVRR